MLIKFEINSSRLKAGTVFLIITVFLTLSAPAFSLKKAEEKSVQNTQLTAQESNKFNYYFYEALKQKELGKYDQAMDLLTKCYYINPKSAIVFYEFSKIYSNIQDTQDALKYMAFASRLDRNNSWYKLGLAELCIKNSDIQNAIRIYEDISKNHPEEHDVDYMLASLYKKTNNPEASIKSLNRVEKTIGINESLSFEKYRLYSDMGKRKKANAEIENLIKKFPNNIRYKIIRADIYVNDKEYDKAKKAFDQIKQKEPNNILLLQSMHNYYMEIKDSVSAQNLIKNAFANQEMNLDDKMELLTQFLTAENQSTKVAEEYFNVLIPMYPSNELLHTYYASFLLVQRRYDEAITELKHMVNMNPSSRESWLELIKTYIDQDKIGDENMISVLDEALKNLPEDPSLHFYKGLFLEKKGKNSEALASLKMGLKYMNEENADKKFDIYMQIADIYGNQNQLDSALYYYETAYQLNSDNAMLLNNYAYFLSVANKDLSKAEVMSAKTVQAFPNNVSFLDTYAWIFFKQGKMILAKMYIQQAIDKGGKDNEVVLEHYGDILSVNNEKSEAINWWKLAQEKGNKSSILKKKIETGTYIPENAALGK